MSNLFEKYITKTKFTLIYGKAGTGKTHLAYYAYKIAEKKMLRPIFIATEPGTTLFLRKAGFDLFITAQTIDGLLREALYHALMGEYVIIDSINWHYRSNPDISYARIISFLSSLLMRTGGLATAQVSGEGNLPSGAPYLIPWTHNILKTSKINDKFLIEVLRPIRKTLMYTVRGLEIKWL